MTLVRLHAHEIDVFDLERQMDQNVPFIEKVKSRGEMGEVRVRCDCFEGRLRKAVILSITDGDFGGIDVPFLQFEAAISTSMVTVRTHCPQRTLHSRDWGSRMRRSD